VYTCACVLVRARANGWGRGSTLGGNEPFVCGRGRVDRALWLRGSVARSCNSYEGVPYQYSSALWISAATVLGWGYLGILRFVFRRTSCLPRLPGADSLIIYTNRQMILSYERRQFCWVNCIVDSTRGGPVRRLIRFYLPLARLAQTAHLSQLIWQGRLCRLYSP